MKALKERFEEKIYYSIDGCWYWIGSLNNSGYSRIMVDGINKLASRVSFELFKGEIGDLFVCHSCDNRCCVNPDHLFLGTNQDNMDDKLKKGRHPHKLTKRQVNEIILLRGVFKQRELAKMYNINRATVSQIQLGLVWNKLINV